jgi:hypothetical protein
MFLDVDVAKTERMLARKGMLGPGVDHSLAEISEGLSALIEVMSKLSRTELHEQLGLPSSEEA